VEQGPQGVKTIRKKKVLMMCCFYYKTTPDAARQMLRGVDAYPAVPKRGLVLLLPYRPLVDAAQQ
jgi:hypothetical protein